uniref:fumarate reductase (NADH) n=1 Tax=Chromera velia CCMP2878 TaxID=1169474 RepID=A0A0G4G8H0_9ALVE|eukprot:Cvel_4349.t1-p1 / transcript=Cvel_4349.t1 / gene=Cvel_4349 / organism=Chromera_velia_CCMP2878 / gene_product=Putative fumarate reductase, putative / transcript_product=Putative fumarate reductase, putative / location=Cvel_scaffold188:95986-97719(+) / protein_length=578 / sequence_SO=supercontig / SO=protein_coding / is_pseudo=false
MLLLHSPCLPFRVARLPRFCVVQLLWFFVFLATMSSVTGERDGNRPFSVIVVGSGLAGLTATIEAEKAGANVILLEKTANTGGNSAKATSGMNATPTRAQLMQHIEDSLHEFEEDVIASGGGFSDPQLVDVLVKSSAYAYNFLETFEGLNLSVVSQCGGHSKPRTHRLPPSPDGKPSPVGWTTVSTLKKFVTSLPAVTLRTNSRVTHLLKDSAGKVGGVGLESGEEVRAGAVVLATGGYSHDRSADSFLSKYAPSVVNLPTTNGNFAEGDGVRLGLGVGAGVVDMDKVQVHPTAFVDPKDPLSSVKFLAPEALRGSGGVLVDSFGERFCNELGRRDEVSEKILSLPGGVAFLLLNDEAADIFGRPNLGFYSFKGFFVEYPDAQSAASALGFPQGSLESTLRRYSESAERGEDSFGKKVFPVKAFDPNKKVMIAKITPAIHYTMGGLKINPFSQVQGENAEPILGLFAAGEVTGGVHGKNRLAGNSLLECVVFGRISGKAAASFSSFLAGIQQADFDFVGGEVAASPCPAPVESLLSVSEEEGTKGVKGMRAEKEALEALHGLSRGTTKEEHEHTTQAQ